jgi:hypothetical protein
MRWNAKRSFPIAASLFLTFAGVSSATERSLDSIRQAWRGALRGVQTYGMALQELDTDAKVCGLERAKLADAVRSGLKDSPLQVTDEDLQLFNIFVDIVTLAGDRCISTISLRVSAFVDPTYAPLLAAEITPWSDRAILSSSREDHARVIGDDRPNVPSAIVQARCDQPLCRQASFTTGLGQTRITE